MLSEFLEKTADHIEYSDEALEKLRKEFTDLQLKVLDAKLPVIVTVDGWDCAGKGSVIDRIIHQLDPRHYVVATTENFNAADQKKPFLWKYFKEVPEAGKFTFYDSSWFRGLLIKNFTGELTQETSRKVVKSICDFERQLVDNGYLLVKIFLHVSKDTQEKRIIALEENPDTSFRVGPEDRWQNQNYDSCVDIFEYCMNLTENDYAHWHIINGDYKKTKITEFYMLRLLCEEIKKALALRGNKTEEAVSVCERLNDRWEKIPMPKLCDVSLKDKVIPKDEYKETIDALQEELHKLSDKIYVNQIPVLIAYEGWDAAGKGGNIKRLAYSLDSRGYRVWPIASPKPEEKSRHFLWRFYERLPMNGSIAIFDRTWYGRVMVERIEGFCSDADWKRAYNEINEFERDLREWGAVVIKLWIQIDKDTQLERFRERQNTPEKQWKITDEDWRNREKWDVYETAIDEMLEKTSTKEAPWYIIESVDKRYARVKTLEIVIDRLKKAIAEKEEKDKKDKKKK